MKTAVFWFAELCRSVEMYQRFIHTVSIIALMMEAASTSETLVNFYQTTRRYNPGDNNL
jgi:hypothetical protein